MKKTREMLDGLFFERYLVWGYNYIFKYQRNAPEINKSTSTKKIATKMTVVITTIVYFVSYLLFGQVVFLISDITSCRNCFILPILA